MHGAGAEGVPNINFEYYWVPEKQITDASMCCRTDVHCGHVRACCGVADVGNPAQRRRLHLSTVSAIVPPAKGGHMSTATELGLCSRSDRCARERLAPQRVRITFTDAGEASCAHLALRTFQCAKCSCHMFLCHLQGLVGWRSGLITQVHLGQTHNCGTESAIENTAGRISACLNLLPQACFDSTSQYPCNIY